MAEALEKPRAGPGTSLPPSQGLWMCPNGARAAWLSLEMVVKVPSNTNHSMVLCLGGLMS